MDEEAKNKFLEVKELFNRISHEIFSVTESYYIWRQLTFSRSTTEVGEDQAKKNVKLLNLYKYFFIPTEYSHLQVFIVGLMKFFDKDSQSLSIERLIKDIEKNKDLFSPSLLRSIYPRLADIGAIKDDYVPITQDIVNQIKKIREPHEALISNLKNIRDKKLAHMDIKIIEATFIPNDVEVLIKVIQEIFNKISNNFDLSITSWSHIENESISSVDLLFKNLERGEFKRRKEYGF